MVCKFGDTAIVSSIPDLDSTNLKSVETGREIVAGYYVWVLINHYFVVGIDTIDTNVWMLDSKYLWTPGTFVLQTLFADSWESG